MSANTHTAPGEESGHRLALATLLLVVLVGFALRAHKLGEECIWHDEYVSFQFLDAPSLGEFLGQVRTVDPPMVPLYFALEYCWARCGGDSVYALRWLSVVAGVLTIPLLYAFTRMHYGRWAGVMAAMWLALSKIHIHLSQEIRMYAVVMLLALCSAHTLWHALRGDGRRWWVLCGLANMLLLGSHLLAVLAVLAQGLFVAIAYRRRWRTVVAWTVSTAPAVALLLLWLLSFDFGATEAAARWIRPPTLGKLLDFLFVVYGGSRFSYGDLLWHRPVAFPSHVVLGVLLAALVGYLAIVSLPRAGDGKCLGQPGRASYGFLFSWFLVPPLALVVLSWVYRPCLVPRYAAYAPLPLAALLGGAVASISGKRLRTAVALALLALASYHLAVFRRPIRLNWRAVAAHLEEHAGAKDTIIVPDGICVAPLRHYLSWPAERVQAGGSFLDEDLHEKQVARARVIVAEGGTAWILSYDVREHRIAHLEQALEARDLPFERWDTPGYRTVSLYRMQKADRVAESEQPPNCLFIILDAAAAKHLRLWGYDRDTTPHIDRLASRGCVFLRAFSQAAATEPSVPSYWTGRTPASIQFRVSVPPDHRALPEAFKALGFRTAGFSENPHVVAARGYARGFDRFEMYLPVGELRAGKDFVLDSEGMMGHVRDWIASAGQAPWFTYIHMLRPHDPYRCPEPFASRFTSPAYEGDADGTVTWFRDHGFRASPEDAEHLAALYDGNLAYADSLVGDLVDWLERRGALEHTLVIIASDHGEAFMEHGRLGHATTCYDEMVHVPLVIVPPRSMGIMPSTSKALVDLVSLLPTLSDVYGFEPDSGFEGISLLPLMRGDRTTGKQTVFTQAKRGVDGPYPNILAVRTAKAKYIVTLAEGIAERPRRIVARELYDLRADSGERTDLVPDDATPPEDEGPRLLESELLNHLARSGTDKPPQEPELPREVQDALRALGYID